MSSSKKEESHMEQPEVFPPDEPRGEVRKVSMREEKKTRETHMELEEFPSDQPRTEVIDSSKDYKERLRYQQPEEFPTEEPRIEDFTEKQIRNRDGLNNDVAIPRGRVETTESGRAFQNNEDETNSLRLHQSAPGAVAVSGPRADLSDLNSAERGEGVRNNAENEDDSSALPVAVGFVEDNRGAVVGMAVDPDKDREEIQRSVKGTLKKRQTRIACGIVLLVVVAAIVTGSVVGTLPPPAINSPTISPTRSLVPTTVPSAVSSELPTMLPSTIPTSGPSSTPSLTPTTVRETMIRECAGRISGPNGTDLVLDAASPQGRAVEYFISGPGQELMGQTIFDPECSCEFTQFAGYEEEQCMTGSNFDQIYALIVLRDSATIPLDSWYPSEVVSNIFRYCSWARVQCSDLPVPSLLIEGLQLDDLSLRGTVPREIAMLKSLVSLNLANNDLLYVPLEPLTAFDQMRTLDLTGTRLLEGTLPTGLGNLTELEELILVDTYLGAATIPTEIGDLGNRLRALHLSSTSIGGSIPDEMGQLSSLQIFHVAFSDMTGTLPSTMGNMTSLQELRIDFSRGIVGTVPTEFGNLVSLLRFSAQGAGLNGAVPDELCFLRTNNMTSPIGALDELQMDCQTRISCTCCTWCTGL